MTNSPNLSLAPPTLGRAQLEHKIRDDVQALDVFAGGFVKVLDRDLTAPPGSPSNGDAYVVATGGTGDWSGHDGEVAYWLTDAGDWQFAAMRGGLALYVVDEDATFVWNGSALAATKRAQVGFTLGIDGGGSAITTGVKHYFEIPVGMTITGWTLVADQVGSIVLDLWKDTYANFPPTVADTITGSEKPTLSAAQKSQDHSLSSWTTSLAQGDIIGVNVDSAATVTKVWLTVRGTRAD